MSEPVSVSRPSFSRLLAPALILLVTIGVSTPQAFGQDVASARSPRKAALLSLAVPGLGHRYVNNGSWSTSASLFVLADVSAWLGIVGANSRRAHTIDSYTVLAASRASADVENKDRRFFLNLATYKSSEDFLDAALRNRAWDQVSYVDDVSFQWQWETDADYAAYRDLRNKAESLRRRRSILIAGLVTNRVFATVTSVLAARKTIPENMAIGASATSRNEMSVQINLTF